ncbi:MAG: response regulator transcription factor [Lachnospiraceae bacterium]|jgi:DNA-binding response OmpR family regulator|nr:response regulator transcription factor [Lachnospiraceae bacterium]
MGEKILIVEDDTDINNLICAALGKVGYDCTQAYSGTESLLYVKHETFALILLDLMLPGLDGKAVLSAIRKDFRTPVIVLSAKDTLEDKVDLLDAGAEDYITKPFEIPELLARVAVQIRRFLGQEEKKPTLLTYKDLQLDTAHFGVTLCGEEIALTRQEFKILELLLSHPTRIYSKQEIYDYAWNDIYIGEDKTINVHVSNIRKKLKQITAEEYIETVWGIGFKLAK